MPAQHQGDSRTIITRSRVRMWWLTFFRGYALESVRRTPKQNFFGEIYYETHWVLMPKTSKNRHF